MALTRTQWIVEDQRDKVTDRNQNGANAVGSIMLHYAHIALAENYCRLHWEIIFH